MKTPSIIDSHCHLDFPAFADDYQQVLTTCKQNGVTDIIIPGVAIASLTTLINFCAKNSQHLPLHYALGLHPVFLRQHKPQDIALLSKLIIDHQPIAIGEIGLDFFLKELNKSAQLSLFTSQLALAKEHQLPIILHVRKAHDDVIRQLQHHKINTGGIVHAFNGSLQQAHHYLDLGFKLGFGGMLTYARSSKLRQLATRLPLSAIVLETDSPDMTVEQHRGQRNSPEYLPMILNALGALREESIDTIANTTSENVRQVFALET